MITNIGAGLGVWGPMTCAYCSLSFNFLVFFKRLQNFYFVAFILFYIFHKAHVLIGIGSYSLFCAGSTRPMCIYFIMLLLRCIFWRCKHGLFPFNTIVP